MKYPFKFYQGGPSEIDLVYLWCDSSNSEWLDKKEFFWKKEKEQYSKNSNFFGAYCDFDELKFSLRSVNHFAPFIRQIYLVTDGQIPKWLKLSPKITLISVRDLIPKNALYPVFTALNIESYIHKIHGLSEYFLFANDDMMFGSPIQFDDFVNPHGKITLRFAPTLIGRPANEAQYYFWACYNSARLMLDSFPLRRIGSPSAPEKRNSNLGILPYLLPGHMIELYSKQICFNAEKLFGQAFEASRNRRFGSHKSYQIPALWKYLAIESGVATSTLAGPESLFISSESERERKTEVFDKLTQNSKMRPKFLCFNNNSSHCNEDWRKYLQALLPTLYPDPSEFEKNYTFQIPSKTTNT